MFVSKPVRFFFGALTLLAALVSVGYPAYVSQDTAIEYFYRFEDVWLRGTPWALVVSGGALIVFASRGERRDHANALMMILFGFVGMICGISLVVMPKGSLIELVDAGGMYVIIAELAAVGLMLLLPSFRKAAVAAA